MTRVLCVKILISGTISAHCFFLFGPNRKGDCIFKNTIAFSGLDTNAREALKHDIITLSY